MDDWDAVDSLVWPRAMAWDLRGIMSAEIDRAALLAHGLSRDQIDQLHPAYPFDRNRAIVRGGTVFDGAFDADAGADTAVALVATVPASASDGAGERVWRDSTRALAALGAAVRSMPGPLGADGTRYPDLITSDWSYGHRSRRILNLLTDRSRWVQLSGTSGHAFHPNYTDRLELWRTGQTTPMRWDPRRE